MMKMFSLEKKQQTFDEQVKDKIESLEGKQEDQIRPRGHIAVTNDNWYDIYMSLKAKYPNAWIPLTGISPTYSSPEKERAEFTIWRMRMQYTQNGFQVPSYVFIKTLVDLGF
jgi:hypothetical protein